MSCGEGVEEGQGSDASAPPKPSMSWLLILMEKIFLLGFLLV